jgi:hypothetical protein
MAEVEVVGPVLDGFANDFQQSFTEHLLGPIGAELFPCHLAAEREGFVAQFHDLPRGDGRLMGAHPR